MKSFLFVIICMLFTIITSCNNPNYVENQAMENIAKKKENLNYTAITVLNSSKEDSVKVYVTLPATDSVMGLFGIKDTISKSKGFFYAKRNKPYFSHRKSIVGGVISFVGDAQPCKSAIEKGFKNGINVFEFTIGVKYEVFDISCEDGVNCIMRASVTDSLNYWYTGSGRIKSIFCETQNKFPIEENFNIRGVFPYRCTDCIDIGFAPPENCFNLPAQCNRERFCQVSRTGHIGGNILIEYLQSCQ